MPIFRNDPALLAAFRAGQRDALERVYRAYVRPIDRYLHWLARKGGNDEMSQASSIADLLQDIFMRAFAAGARGSFDASREYGPYLAAIARNCYIDVTRKQGRELPVAIQDLDIELHTLNVEPASGCEPRVSAVLNAYLAGLGVVESRVCEGRFLQGLSQEEVCSALGLSRRELRTIEERLRAGLRSALVRAGIPLRELTSGYTQRPAREALRVVERARP